MKLNDIRPGHIDYVAIVQLKCLFFLCDTRTGKGSIALLLLPFGRYCGYPFPISCICISLKTLLVVVQRKFGALGKVSVAQWGSQTSKGLCSGESSREARGGQLQHISWYNRNTITYVVLAGIMPQECSGTICAMTSLHLFHTVGVIVDFCLLVSFAGSSILIYGSGNMQNENFLIFNLLH